jgi:hypothetical protein
MKKRLGPVKSSGRAILCADPGLTHQAGLKTRLYVAAVSRAEPIKPSRGVP